SFDLEQILDSSNGMPERAVGVVEQRRHAQCLLLFFLGRGREIIRMIFATQSVECFFERGQINTQKFWNTENFEVVHWTMEIRGPQLCSRLALEDLWVRSRILIRLRTSFRSRSSSWHWDS